MRRPVGPDEHKTAVRALGLRGYAELVAAGSPSNDPFYYGSDGDWELARWFAALWQRFGGPGAHLRRIHYRATENGVLTKDGEPYLNGDKAQWQQLSKASRAARYLGLIDPEDFADRRTEGVRQNVQPRLQAPEADVEVTDSGGVCVPGLPAAPVLDNNMEVFFPPEAEVTGYDYQAADQPVLLEVVVEKSTMDDVLVPLCRRLGVNLKVGKGTESITTPIRMLRRAEALGKPLHVFYIADLDRNGEAMPVALARQLEFWAWKLGIDVPVTLERLALTVEQVKQYNLPKAPDSGNTELDALEALHPGELARIVTEAVQQWQDPDLPDRLSEAGNDAEEAVKQALENATAEIEDEADDLAEAVGEIRDRYLDQLRPLAEQWRQITGAYDEEVAGHLATAGDLDVRLGEAVEAIDWDLPERPEADEPDADTEDVLYDSGRDWLDQLDHYHAARRIRQ